MAVWAKRCVAAALAAVLITAAAPAAMAGGGDLSDWEEDAQEAVAGQAALTMNVKSAILLEQTTGQVLYETNADEQMPPASITKVMTLLLAMEAVETGKLKLTDMISCTEHASTMGGSQIWLEPGEQMSVDDLLKATAISSANDAAVLLAEAVAGSEEAFVEMMNARAKELGMTGTVFKNASGLDESGHVSTARDIAAMSRELVRHELIRNYCTVWMDSLRGGETELVNTNKLVRFYEGATGLKTGTTNGAGSCLTATAQRGELSLVAVVLGAPTSNERFEGARKLLDFGFANYAMAAPPDISAELTPVKVIGGVENEVTVELAAPQPFVVRQGQEDKMQQRISLVPDVYAPVEQGQTLGKVLVTLDEMTVAEYDLKAAHAVEKMTFWRALIKLMENLVSYT